MVVIEVQESTTAELEKAGRWFGGFQLEFPANTLCKQVVEAVAARCLGQLGLLDALEQSQEQQETEDKKGERAMSILSAFPFRLSAQERKELKANEEKEEWFHSWLVDAETKWPTWSSNSGRIWWVKKPFDMNEPLSKRVGKNEKTKVKVFFTSAGQDFENLIVETNVINQLANESWFVSALEDSKAWRRSKVQSQGKKRSNDAAVESHENPDKRRKEGDFDAVDLSFIVSASHQARFREFLEAQQQESWSLPKERLELLDSNEQVQKQLRDERLLRVLAKLEASNDRLKALDELLDTDSYFAKFVDLVLTTIGAQQTVEESDGTTRIESTLSQILKESKPAFLASQQDEDDISESERDT